jgi:hypothetical protein
MRRPLLAGTGLLLGVLLPLSAEGVEAQGGVTAREEATAIRQAAGLEWRGDLDEAENVLMSLLAAKPVSTGGIFALERVTRARDRLHLVLPFADTYLAEDPSAGGIRALKLRILAEVDSLSALRPEAEAWAAAEPGEEDPWREIARIWEDAFGPGPTEALLREARERLDDEGALAVELGTLRAEAGDPVGAIGEWSVAVRRPDADLPRMRRRVAGLAGDPATWIDPMFEALTQEPTSVEGRRTAVWMALELGLHERADALAEDVVTDLRGSARSEFLEEVVRQGEAAEARDLTLWALGTLRRDAGSAGAPGLDVRIASAALAVGDTARALEAQARLARALPAGSEERRRVIADLIRVESGQAVSTSAIRQRFEGFRAEFGSAPELDELAALTAVGMSGAGDPEEALEVLGDPTVGPRAMLERGYIRLALGDAEVGLADLEAALPGLAPEAATEVIQLLTGMQRTTPAGAAALSAAAALHRWDRNDEALSSVRIALETVPPEDRAVLLAAGARHALAAGELATAEVFLDGVVGGFPEAPERPEAMLRLAELRASSDAGREDAVRLLEELIVEGPERAVVPAARRLLTRIRGEGA